MQTLARSDSTRSLVSTYLVLIGLAGASLGLAHVPLDHRLALAIALAIGAVKAAIVLSVFMRLTAETFGFKLVMAVAAALVLVFVGLSALDPMTRMP
jgi:cytochrome c oxidase subunit IV